MECLVSCFMALSLYLCVCVCAQQVKVLERKVRTLEVHKDRVSCGEGGREGEGRKDSWEGRGKER